MKYLGFVMILVLFVVSSCEKNPEELRLGIETTIKFNESAFLYDDGQEIEFRFKSLVHESRCPPNVTCFWAGQAIIELEVNSDEVFNLVTCFTKPNCSEQYIASYAGYEIELVWVTYSQDRHYGDESKYSIIIIVNM